MAQRPNPPKGMRDLAPSEVRRRRHLTASILEAFERFGYEQIETPALEELSRLIGSEGGDNEKLIYKTLRRGLDLTQGFASESDLTDLGLRYDLTVPLARYYATHSGDILLPLKAVQIGPVWRAERPQKGRYRQFVQCDIDNIGDATVNAEIELLTAGVQALNATGVSNFVVRINDRRLLNEILRDAGFQQTDWPTALIEIDKYDKIGVDGVRTNLLPFGEKQADAIAELLNSESSYDAITARIPAAAAIVDGLALIEDSVSAATDVKFQFDPTLVRGQGYYTGTIFEIFHPESSGSLGGGGRYDNMIGKLSGTEAPACGFSIGFERLFDVLGEPSESDERIALLHDGDIAEATRVATQFRKNGTPVRIDTLAKNRTAQLNRLAEAGYTQWIDLPSGNHEPRPLSKEGK